MSEQMVYVQGHDLGNGESFTGMLPASEVDLPFLVLNAAGRLRARFEDELHAEMYASTLVGGRIVSDRQEPAIAHPAPEEPEPAPPVEPEPRGRFEVVFVDDDGERSDGFFHTHEEAQAEIKRIQSTLTSTLYFCFWKVKEHREQVHA